MKVLYYLIGSLVLLYIFVLFYENNREKEFLKKDLQEGGIKFVNSMEEEAPSVLMQNDWNIKSAQKYGTTLLDEMGNTYQGDLKRAVDDVKGAIPLRKN